MDISFSLNFPLQLLYGDPPDGEESSKEIVGGDIPEEQFVSLLWYNDSYCPVYCVFYSLHLLNTH